MCIFKKAFLSTIFLFSFKNELINDVACEYRKSYSNENISEINNISSKIPSCDIIEKFDKTTFLELAFKVIDNSEYAKQIQNKKIIGSNEYENLNIFHDTTQDRNNSFISKIDRTESYCGKTVLSLLVANLTNDVDILNQRKAVISFLINNKEAYEKLSRIVKKFKKIEPYLLSLYSHGDSLYNKFFYDTLCKNFLCSNRNNHAKKLEFKKRIKNDFIYTELPILCRLVIPLVYTIGGFPIIQLSPDKAMLKYLWGDAIPIFSFFYKSFGYFPKEKFPDRHTLSSYGVRMSKEVAYLYLLYTTWCNFSNNNSQLDTLFERMTKMRDFIKIAKNIKIFEEKYNLTTTKHFIDIFLEKENTKSDIGKMMNYIDNLPLKNRSFFFNNTGKLLASFDILVTNLNDLNEIFYEIGLLDAYLSIAKLILNSKHKNSYCFVDFIQTDNQPCMISKGLWNPFIDPQNAVENDINLDYKNEKTIIITGPNAGGKSTYIKGVLYNTIMAQSLGISAAKQTTLTPFTKISAFFDATNNISSQQGKSAFLSSVINTKSHIQDLNKKEYSLCVFDDVFCGADPSVSSALEYSMIENINDKFENNLTIMSTHRTLVSSLEDKRKNIKNYRIYITKDENGKIVYNYKIIKGVSYQRIGIDLLKQNGYKNEIIDKASKIVRKQIDLD